MRAPIRTSPATSVTPAAQLIAVAPDPQGDFRTGLLRMAGAQQAITRALMTQPERVSQALLDHHRHPLQGSPHAQEASDRP